MRGEPTGESAARGNTATICESPVCFELIKEKVSHFEFRDTFFVIRMSY